MSLNTSLARTEKPIMVGVGMTIDNNTCGIVIGKDVSEGYFIPNGSINGFIHIVVASWTFTPVQKIAMKCIIGALKSAGVEPISGVSATNPDNFYYLDLPRGDIYKIIAVIRRVVKGISVMKLEDNHLKSLFIEDIVDTDRQQLISDNITADRIFLMSPSAIILEGKQHSVHSFL